MPKKRRQKKYVVEEGIFNIYPDFPIFINDKVTLDADEVPLHFHHYLEIGYCLEGKAVFSSNSKIYDIVEKDIIITASNILHSARSHYEEEKSRFAYIYLDISHLLKMFPTGDAKTQLAFMKDILSDIIYVEGSVYPEILWLLNEMIRIYKEKSPSYKMQVVGLMYLFMLKIYDLFSAEINEREESQNLPIKPAIEYIFDRYMEPIKVEQLAKECHFSESYFRKVFQEMKGMTPMEYLNSIRIREACRMLMNTTGSIRMVGEKCGFPSVTTFERNFKQRTGMLPSQWRESQKNPRVRNRNAHAVKRTYHYE